MVLRPHQSTPPQHLTGILSHRTSRSARLSLSNLSGNSFGCRIVLCIGKVRVGSEHIHHQPVRFDRRLSTLLLQPDDQLAPLQTSSLNKRKEHFHKLSFNSLVNNHTSSSLGYAGLSASERKQMQAWNSDEERQLLAHSIFPHFFFKILTRHNLTSQPLLDVSFSRLSEAQLSNIAIEITGIMLNQLSDWTHHGHPMDSP